MLGLLLIGMTISVHACITHQPYFVTLNNIRGVGKDLHPERFLLQRYKVHMVFVSQLRFGFIDLDKFSQTVRTFSRTQVNQTSMMLPRLYLMINDSWLPVKHNSSDQMQQMSSIYMIRRNKSNLPIPPSCSKVNIARIVRLETCNLSSEIIVNTCTRKNTWQNVCAFR